MSLKFSEDLPIIMTFGLETSLNDILQIYLQNKYRLIRINQEISFQYIRMYENVMLLIINSDQPWIRNSNFVKKIKQKHLFQNIPIIGLCLKKYFQKMEKSEKYLYDDILLLPFNNEDFLARIEVWTNTTLFLKNYEKKSKTHPLDTLEF